MRVCAVVCVISGLMFFLTSCSTTQKQRVAAKAVDDKAVTEMTAAASRFVDALSADNKAKAVYEFTGKERKNWNFLPDKYIKPDGKRYGLPISQMTEMERIFAHALLSSALSQKGYLKASSVMALEQVLFDMTKSKIRDPKLYYVSIYGNPAKDETWGWRFEGHHLSINVTLIKKQYLSVTPTFFATNPGIVKEGNLKGLQVLKGEEELARELAKSLSAEQFKKCLIMEKAPKDIFSGFKPKITREFFDPKKGIPYSELTAGQKAMLLELCNLYIEKFRPELIDVLENTPVTETDSMVFAWGGSLEPEQGHYYRIVTKNHMIEYDNVQNGARHVHCVWRNFDGDFGENLLLKHHKEKHSK